MRNTQNHREMIRQKWVKIKECEKTQPQIPQGHKHSEQENYL